MIGCCSGGVVTKLRLVSPWPYLSTVLEKQRYRKLVAKLRHESEALTLQHGKRLDLDATLE
jgi:hypothetical protein